MFIEDELASIAARQYYINFGTEMRIEQLRDHISHSIPDNQLVQNKAVDRWVQMIVFNHKKEFISVDNLPSALQVKEDIVNYARFKWPLLFSRFYEAYKFSGPTLPKNEVIIAVNWTGVYVIDDQEQVLLELSFPEITEVKSTKSVNRSHHSSFTLVTIKNERYTFTSNNAEDIRDLIINFLEGLKHKSKFCITIHDYDAAGGRGLSVRHGDLVVLVDDPRGKTTEAFLYGLNERTGLTGEFPSDCVYILPTMTKPPPEVIHMFALLWSSNDNQEFQGDHLGSNLLNDENVEQNLTEIGYTLEKYAETHFRAPPKRTWSNTFTRRQGNTLRPGDYLWSFQKEPLRQPLLKKLQEKQELTEEASACFINILKYMGDYGAGVRRKATNDLTDAIFESALRTVCLIV